MKYESEVAIILWDRDYKTLNEKLKERGLKTCDNLFKQIGTVTTPDESYICMYSPRIVWESRIEEIGVIKCFLRKYRHSFIRIGEDIDDIEESTESQDWRGVDGEFEVFIDVCRRTAFFEYIEGLDRFGIVA